MRSEILKKAEKYAADAVSLFCAMFMLCVVPLLFRDAFFDINRVKVNAVITVIPPLLLCFGAVSFMFPNKEKSGSTGDSIPISMALFLISCVLSCALAGFERSTLDGSEGRYCGLYFMLSCGAAFYMIAQSGHAYIIKLLPVVLICAAVCALVGILNAMGVDPLGFYMRIRKDQRTIFLSTIGHFDFFGTYLTIMCPLAGGWYVFSERKSERMLGLVCAVVIALGAMASRTDSALAALHMGCFMLVALSGGSWQHMERSLFLWAACFAALPAMGVMLQFSAFRPPVSGLPGMLIEMHIGEAAAVFLGIIAVIVHRFECSGRRAPGRKTFLTALISVFLAAALAAIALMIWFSVFDLETELGSAASFLRFNDKWGTLRGFAWIRSIRAFGDFPPMQKLTGAGMERTLHVLSPYFDDPAMLTYGVFNDPHCQPLQMLLTCGLLGMAAFLLLYFASLISFVSNAQGDPLLCGAAASVWAYGIIMLINVTQPILIATYFSVCALGLSALRGVRIQKEGKWHES